MHEKKQAYYHFKTGCFASLYHPKDHLHTLKTMATKRSTPATASSSLVKRTRVESEEASSSSLVPISSSREGADKGLVRTVKRTSRLSDPIISLSGGHQGAILDVRFSLDGQLVAAAGEDRTISIWNTYSPNSHVTSLASHSKAVTCLAWLPSTGSSALGSSGPFLLSGSADSTIILWGPLAPPPHNKVRRFRYHQAVVNAVVPSPSDATLFASGSDDGNVCIWNREEKKPREVLRVGYPVTALEWTKDGSGLFVGGIDNQIHLYDLHQKAILYSLSLHTDTITTLRLSPSGSYLFSFGFDSSLKVWDVRPFAISSNDLNPSDSASSTSEQRIYKTLSGALAPMDNALIKGNWSKDGKRIILGSGDRSCVVWDVESSKIMYKLPGHRGTCTAGDYHPKEPIVISSSVDGQLLLGEIEP